ncbi:MAG: hypothetical protein PWP24_1626, partial [Clostridiales bacterium]|nr:hypothetical protein [Clostridiales bacterium]
SIAQYNSKLQYSLENQQLQLEQRHLQEINQLYENLRKLRHELKNHILCMDILLQEQNYEELSTYFLALKEAQPLAPSLDFGNHSINALLNTKLAIAKEKDISFSIEAHVPTHLYISDFDICSILGNLCDNAMEACEASSEKNMKLAILEYGSYLSVTLRNDTTSDVLSLNPTLLTTKKDKQLHGIGIQIVKTIAKKYDGLVFFKTEENQFIASVQLKNQKKHSDTT